MIMNIYAYTYIFFVNLLSRCVCEKTKKGLSFFIRQPEKNMLLFQPTWDYVYLGERIEASFFVIVILKGLYVLLEL